MRIKKMYYNNKASKRGRKQSEEDEKVSERGKGHETKEGRGSRMKRWRNE